MKRILCPALPRVGHTVEIPPDEAKHALTVFRLRDGDRIEAIDGKGGSVIARLRVRGKSAQLEVDSEAVKDGAAAGDVRPGDFILPLVLELAVLKSQAMEWAIEKAVELGARQVQPVLTAHTVVQMDRKGPEAFQERWQKIADQALKQCGRLQRLEVLKPLELELVAQRKSQAGIRLWCDESARDSVMFLGDRLANLGAPLPPLHLLIGPEGGWSELEKKLLATAGEAVSLGPLVLRAETAALFAVCVVSSHFQSAKLDNIAQKPESS